MKFQNTFLTMFATALLTACGGGHSSTSNAPTLKEVFGDQFLVGTAINTQQATGLDTAAVKIIKRHFNSVVAENDMKCEVIHPEENRYDFEKSDAFVKFAEENKLSAIGHCLVWHSQWAPWFCVDEKGKNVSAEILKQRLKDHITTIVSRYKGKIKGWDVVNEAILEDGSYRNSWFYQILGEEFIPLVFQYAHEADPDAELYLNDYNMHAPEKCKTYVRIIQNLKKRGLRIDAIGMQGHMGMDYPSIEEFEASLTAYAATGVKVMITEWDMSALPTVNRTANVSDTIAFKKAMNPYTEALPDSISQKWNARMKEFFNLFLKHADVVSRVTAWGVSDGESWKNDFPVHGRTDYPLLFDRNHQLKPFLNDLMKDQNKTVK